LGRVTVADTVHWSGLVKGSMMASVTGVWETIPPEVAAVWLPSVQLAVQFTDAL
jgi:hypothetical protein